MNEQRDDQEHQHFRIYKVVELRDVLQIQQESWMASNIDTKDTRFVEVLREVVALLPPQPTAEDIARAVRKRNMAVLGKLAPDLKTAEAIVGKHRTPLTQRFLNRDTPLLGEYFDEEKPANVCQQNVLLTSGVGALYGIEIGVAGFIYTGTTSGKDLVHAVAIYTDPASGKEYILDPTLSVPRYGDVTFLPKEEYLQKFLNPRLGATQNVFSPRRKS